MQKLGAVERKELKLVKRPQLETASQQLKTAEQCEALQRTEVKKMVAGHEKIPGQLHLKQLRLRSPCQHLCQRLSYSCL